MKDRLIVVSNHLFATTHVKFPGDIVVRVNLAWLKDTKTAIATLGKIKHAIYLDYPQGRSKPPRPTITLSEALQMATMFKNIKYFAVSNVEKPEKIAKIRSRLPAHIELVPKIESKKGVEHLPGIMKSAKSRCAMLDKEDLYTNVGCKMKPYEKLIKDARAHAKKSGFKLIELQGVVFA